MLGATHAANEHDFREDGRRPCGPGCELVVSVCSCGLAKRERVLDGTVRTVDVRLPDGNQWHYVVDLLRVDLPFVLCPRCKGRGCGNCQELGTLARHAGVAVAK